MANLGVLKAVIEKQKLLIKSKFDLFANSDLVYAHKNGPFNVFAPLQKRTFANIESHFQTPDPLCPICETKGDLCVLVQIDRGIDGVLFCRNWTKRHFAHLKFKHSLLSQECKVKFIIVLVKLERSNDKKP